MSSLAPSLTANPAPDQLRALVLDYLCHSCYTKTARAFDRESTVRQLDADGDEITMDAEAGGQTSSDNKLETLLKQVELRQNIRLEILSGRVDSAIDLLNEHFPSVLSEDVTNEHSIELGSRPSVPMSNLEYISSTSTEPIHLLLNLKILAFSEACRTIPLDYPSKPSDPMELDEDLPSSIQVQPALELNEESPEVIEQQMSLLNKAQKLYALTSLLSNPAERLIYDRELENVSGLLAYRTPEKSLMAKYLTFERREAVADQINRAILKSTGRPLISAVELLARYTTLIWRAANEHGVKARPGLTIPPKNSRTNHSNEVPSELVPLFDLHQFLEAKP